MKSSHSILCASVILSQFKALFKITLMRRELQFDGDIHPLTDYLQVRTPKVANIRNI